MKIKIVGADYLEPEQSTGVAQFIAHGNRGLQAKPDQAPREKSARTRLSSEVAQFHPGEDQLLVDTARMKSGLVHFSARQNQI